MTKLIMGVLVTPDSFERDDLPGVWWPCAHLTDTKDGQVLEDFCHDIHENSKERADYVALTGAAKRIRAGEHR